MIQTAGNAYVYPDHVEILVLGRHTNLPIRCRDPAERRCHWDTYLTAVLLKNGWHLNTWHSPLGRGNVPWQLTSFCWRD